VSVGLSVWKVNFIPVTHRLKVHVCIESIPTHAARKLKLGMQNLEILAQASLFQQGASSTLRPTKAYNKGLVLSFVLF